MKKIIALLGLLFVVSLVGCDLGQSEFDKAIEQLQTMESVTIEMTTSIPTYEFEIVANMLIDGNYSAITIDEETTYEFVEDDKYYTLEDFGTNYLPKEIQFEDALGFSALDFNSDADTMIEDDFELIDGWYVYSLDDPDFDELKILIADDSVQSMFFASEEDGLRVEITLDFSNFNETSVNLPGNIIILSQFNDLKDQLIEMGFDFEIQPLYSEFVHGNTVISCEIYSDGGICNYQEYPTSWTFLIDGSDFGYNDGGYTSLDDLYAAADLELPKEGFEVVMQILDLIYN
ncbi:MAG: hypothetical protein JXB08_06275 [Bacilli bacterium]|nr:hypothetical protein [Bacilli bacterium]MBN2877276.1 hypothetical protein [Bacilli bacterium]